MAKPPTKRSSSKRDEDDLLSLRNRIIGAAAMVLGMAMIIIGLAEAFPQGAVDKLGVDACRYLSVGSGGLLTAVGVVYLIRG